MAKQSKAAVVATADSLTFSFANGPVLEARLAEIPESLHKRLALHGLEQKLRDAYAGLDASEAYPAASAVYSALCAGEWGRRQASSGPREEPIDLLVKAVDAVLRKAKKTVPPDLRARIEELDRSARAKLRQAPEVAAEIARLKGGESKVLSSLLG